MLTKVAWEVLKSRYFLKNEEGEIIEDFDKLAFRVAKAISEADKVFEPKAQITRTIDKFYDLIFNLKFLPNTPTLMNAGLKRTTGSLFCSAH